MGLFNVDYNVLLWQNMPVRFRKNIHYSWLKCLITPVIYLHELFSTNRAGNLYRLSHNSQVCYMEAMLNDTFDNTARGIFISDGIYRDPVYVYELVEDKPVFLDLVSEIGTGIITAPDPVPLYTGAETNFTAPFFFVNVPSAIVFDTDRIKAMIDLYRLPGRNNYGIITY